MYQWVRDLRVTMRERDRGMSDLQQINKLHHLHPVHHKLQPHEQPMLHPAPSLPVTEQHRPMLKMPNGLQPHPPRHRINLHLHSIKLHHIQPTGQVYDLCQKLRPAKQLMQLLRAGLPGSEQWHLYQVLGRVLPEKWVLYFRSELLDRGKWGLCQVY